MFRAKKPLPWLLLLALLWASAQPFAFAKPFTEIKGALPSQPVSADSQLVYWDQAAADALGLGNPPGRVGTPELQEWVRKNLGHEVREGAEPQITGQAQFDAEGAPYLFVEMDYRGGAGRAAYIRVGENSWVNVKGVGQTGYGASTSRGPPSAKFQSHNDGSATLEEAIKEAIYARITDNELERGSSRVVGIMTTGRFLEFPDKRRVPEALIFRAPMRRTDQSRDTKAVTDALAEMSARKILKGDYVNPSNMGSNGQLVDFGCITHTCDYIPAKSSQNAMAMREHERKFPILWYSYDAGDKRRYLRSLGYYLANQMGIPESHLAKVPEKELSHLGESFRDFALASATGPKIDFAYLTPDQLHHEGEIGEIFPELAPVFFENTLKPKLDYVEQMEEMRKLAVKSAFGYSAGTIYNGGKELSQEMLRAAYDVFQSVASTAPVGNFSNYAASLRSVSHFKNRDLSALVRPNLFAKVGEATNAFRENPDPSAVQNFIDATVAQNRLGTGSLADANMSIDADEKETRLFIKAKQNELGQAGLFAYPELAQAEKDENFGFRISTDQWGSFHDFPAALVQTDLGPYFQISIPHQSGLPVTDQPTQLAPYIQKADGSYRWMKDGDFQLRGPPLFLNERLGLAADHLPRADLMHEIYELPVRPQVPSVGKARLLGSAVSRCGELFRELSVRK